MHGKRAAELLEDLRKSKWLPPYNVGYATTQFVSEAVSDLEFARDL